MDLPLGENNFLISMISLKSTSKGYASLDYNLSDYISGDLKKLDIMINNETVDALSFITHSKDAYHRGVSMCSKTKRVDSKANV